MSDQDGPNLAELASKAVNEIRRLSESRRLSDRLRALNVLMFIFVLGLSITQLLGGLYESSLLAGALFIISLLFAAILSLGYMPVLAIVSNLSPRKIEGLRLSISILIVALTVAVAGLVLDFPLLSSVAVTLVGLQLVVMPIGSFILQAQCGCRSTSIF